MSETDEMDDAAARLEAALERIARHARPGVVPEGVDTAEIAARLDRLIGQLRGALES